MKTQALKGMRDLLPNEQTLRDYIQGKILETYRASGFERISTPMLEDMENLDKSDGGDNLNLIFKVLKRGDKLTAALNSGDPKELSDMGLRYDLTLPLSRFYAANKDKLPHPFKVIQTDRVFRAERPQKGRLREFVQSTSTTAASSAGCWRAWALPPTRWTPSASPSTRWIRSVPTASRPNCWKSSCPRALSTHWPTLSPPVR